jgi:hypothetical protein
MAESAEYSRYLLRATELGHRLWRFNIGLFWAGRDEDIGGGKILLHGARRVHCGKAGMSDIMGWTAVKVTPDMVGKTLPVFTSIEVKPEKRGVEGKKQADWIAMVKMHGGIAGFSRSLDEYGAIVSEPLVGAIPR